MERDEIIIRSAIMHILDTSVGMPVLSDVLLESGPGLNDFIRNHIYKIAAGDDKKTCLFNREESLVYNLLNDYAEENLVSFSQEVSKHLYTVMCQNVDIPSADFIVVSYQYASQMYLAFLKLNYKETLVHYTDGSQGFNQNLIVKQTATLPGSGTKLSEAVLICLEDYKIQLVEKKYEVNGTKTNYLSKLFLQCQADLSPKAKLNIVTKAVEQINQKYFEEDFDKQLEAKSIIQSEIAEQGFLSIPVITEKIYGEQPEIKEEFTEKLEKYHIHQEEIKPQSIQTIKKLEKQFLTTDCGIEINIPMEEYNNPQNIEFITNADGTISVLIKNINRIKTK